jgi:peptide subunit release factor 1 (eRF1)
MITAATKGGSGVLGLADVLMALQEQRIRTLVVAEGFEVPGYLCQNCNYVGAEQTGNCPICNGTMVEVDDAVDTAVRRAIDQGADVEVIQNGDSLVNAGSVGAILRY